MNGRRTGRAALAFLVCTLALCGPGVRAEKLPLRVYTSENGLPNDEVWGIESDSSGFLWILTRTGLSRFDGYAFTNFGPEQGLPAGTAHDLLETGTGEILVAASDGVYLLNPEAEESHSIFEKIGGHAVDPFSAQVLVEGRSGTVWCGAFGGVYRLDREGGSWSIRAVGLDLDWDFGATPVDPDRFSPLVTGIVEDRAGFVWIGVRDVGGLLRLAPDGTVRQYTTRDGLPSSDLRSLLEDAQGRIWAGTSGGLVVLDANPDPGGPLVSRVFSEDDGLAGRWIPDILEDSSGRVWAGTNMGLSRFVPEAPVGSPSFRSYTMANGLSDRWITALAEDRWGSLWLGTSASGVMRLSRTGFTTFGPEDGLGGDAASESIFEDRTGSICTVSGVGSLFINRFDGERFVAVRPSVPDSIVNRGWGWNQLSFQHSNGEWWVPTFEGAVRFPAVDRFENLEVAVPLRVYSTADGLASNDVFRLYEDSAGDVWIGTAHHTIRRGNSLHRWDRRTDAIDAYDDVAGIPSDTVTAFAEAPNGDLWMGFYGSGVGRLRGRTFRHYTEDDGAVSGAVEQLRFDRTGRLWIALASRGLVRIDDPAADQPRFRRYTPSDGLPNHYVRCVTEDPRGRIWIGTWYGGAYRLDPERGHVRNYSRHDGLPCQQVITCLTDREGALWFSTSLGVSRFVTGPEPDPEPPHVWIRSVRVAGGEHREYALGATGVAGMVLAPNQREMRIEYTALSFRPGEELRFRYRLGGGSSDWSESSVDREVNFANLAPGRYAFEVQALTSEGLVSPEPASVSFRVMAPVWRRWWFVSLMAALVTAVAFAFHRVRVRRLVELERVRTRIATDLHDDIGSSLSQVSILSEVVRQQVNGGDPKAAEPLLEQIAGTARELVDSMSDIVWAVNPKRDRAADLVQRMRRFASDTISGMGIAFSFEAPETGQDRRLDVETRRQVYLIFKEAVNNAAKHAASETIRIDFRVDGKGLRLTVDDDGRGFDPASGSEGHGLESMQDRAGAIGGALTIESRQGAGTTVRLHVPV